jgi:hypothetical protein
MSKARRIADSLVVTDEINIRDVTSTELVERTTYGTGTDIGPLIATAALRLRLGGTQRGTVRIPSGVWLLSTGVNDDATAGIRIVGAGISATRIMFDATNGTAFRFDGENAGAAGWGGSGIGNLSIRLGAAALGIGTPTAISLQGKTGLVGPAPVSEPDDFWLENVYVDVETAATARWYSGFFAYGNDRTSAQGIRVATIKNLQIFECTGYAAYMSNIVQWSVDNLGTYGAGGPTGNDVYVTGGGASTTNSNYGSFNLLNCGGTLFITNCSNMAFNLATATAITTSAADYIHGNIRRTTQAGSFGANSTVQFVV